MNFIMINSMENLKKQWDPENHGKWNNIGSGKNTARKQIPLDWRISGELQHDPCLMSLMHGKINPRLGICLVYQLVNTLC